MNAPRRPHTESVAAASTRPSESAGVDRLAVLACSWLVGGFYLDVWAHHRFPQLETFFTPWHGVLYSGFLAVTTVLAGLLLRNRARGYAWRWALPAGYELSLLGVALFAAGGLGDMAWHILFGIEVNTEALLSPTHLLLALGAGLIVSGPLRSAWWRPAATVPPGWSAGWPALVSLAFTLSLLTSFTEYGNALSQPWAAAGRQTTPVDLGQALGVAGILLYAGLLMGVTLLALWRGLLPPGGLTVIFTLNAALTVFPHGEYRFIPVALLAGLLADLLLRWWRPSTARPGALRGFAFAVPAGLFTLYFLVLALTGGVWWSIHLWAGAIVLAGLVGWLLSFLLVPPQSPAIMRAAGW